MKKSSLLALALLLVLPLAACGGNDNNTTGGNSTNNNGGANTSTNNPNQDTNNGGNNNDNESDAITVAEAIEIIKTLPQGESTTETYKVTGYVSNSFTPKESSSTPGAYNFDMVDTQGGQALICWYLTGSTAPVQGEAITVEGKLTHFYNASKDQVKYEVTEGTFTLK